VKGPHQNQPVRVAGMDLSQARGAMVMLHGRGATAESILSLVPELGVTDFAYLAPPAGGNSWWPQSFLAPIPQNEPGISSAMQAVQDVLARVEAAGVPADRTVLLGFSQGACLAAEFAARNARRYGGVASLSGGLIGPNGTPRDYEGSLEGTPVFLGCSDVDSHIPAERVRQSAEVLERLGGEVTMRLYPGMGHTIIENELETVRTMMNLVVAGEARGQRR
jgi:phospholipase/carboxylesterase